MANNVTKIILTAEDRTAGALNAVKGSISGISSAAASLGVALSAGGIAAFVKSTIDAADNLNDLSQRLGIGVKQLAGYKLAAEQSGASLESVAKGIKGFSTYAAQNGGVLKKLGIDTKDANKAMVQLADIFAALPDDMQKNALATKLFGKAGQDLIPMLNGGSKALQEAKDEAAGYGKQMEAIAPLADQFNDGLSQVSLSAKTAGLGLAATVLPAMNDLIEFTIRAQKELGGFSGLLVGLVGGGLLKSFGVELNDMKRSENEVQDLFTKRAAAIHEVAAAQKELTEYKDTPLAGLSESNLRAAQANLAAVSKELNAAIKWNKELIATEAAGSERRNAIKKAAADAQARANALLEGEGAASKKAKEGRDELAKSSEKWLDALQKETGTLADQIAKQQEHNDMLGLTREQQDMLAASKLDLAAAAKEEEAANLSSAAAYAGPLHDAYVQAATDLKAQAEQLKELARLKAEGVKKQGDIESQQAAADAAKKQADAAAKEWEKFNDQIEQSLTDALMRGFENGASFGENFVESLKNTLKTAALKIVVQAIVQPITGSITGVLGGNGSTINSLVSGGGIGGGTSLFSSASSIWSALSPDSLGGNAVNNFATSKLGQFFGLSQQTAIGADGTLVAAGGSTGIAADGTSLTSAGQFFSDAAPYFSSLILLAQGETTKALGSAVGAYVGSLFGAPYLGAWLGSGVDKVYPKDNKFLRDTFYDPLKDGDYSKFIKNSLTAEPQLLGNALTSFGDLVVGLLGGKTVQNDPHNNPSYYGLALKLDKNGVGAGSTGFVAGRTSGEGMWAELRKLNAEQLAAINAGTLITFAQGVQIAQRIGVDPSLVANAKVDSLKDGTFQPGLGKSFGSLQEAMAALGDSIIKSIIPNFSQIQQKGESLTDMMSRLTQEFDFTESVARMQGKSGQSLFGNITARDAFVQLFGGLDQAQSSIGTYAQNFYSSEEQVRLGKSNIAATLKGLGIEAAPETRAQFRALVDAQDLTTQSGQRMYAALIAVSSAFAEVSQSADALAAGMSKDDFKTRADYVFAQKTGKKIQYGDELGTASELANLRSEMRAMVLMVNKAAKVLDRWDGDGMPEVRVVA